jgi:hypothetical protein
VARSLAREEYRRTEQEAPVILALTLVTTLVVGRRCCSRSGRFLDNTAFLFRVQSTDSDIREALAGDVQPLISDAAAAARNG